MTRICLFAFAAMSLASVAFGKELEEQRSDVQEKLELERGVLAALKEQRVGVLEALESTEKGVRESQARVRATRSELGELERKLEILHRRERGANEALDQAMREMSPRLRWLYRSSRSRQLDWILSSSDFFSLITRSRALGTIVRSDLALLQKAADALARVKSVRSEMESTRASLAAQIARMQSEERAEAQRKAELSDLLEVVRADTSHHLRLRVELEREEQKLSKMIERLERLPPGSAFLRLKGTLPMPAQGTVEVSFGQLVNPKFNTVVQQKGLDIRALNGSPVRAIARGKIVHSGWMRGYGNLLIVDHGDGFHTLMAHLADFVRGPGDWVDPGDVVGLVGDTGSLKGPYLYFELRQNGQAINPAPWLAGLGRAMARSP